MTTISTPNLSINLRQGFMKCITYSWLVGLAINAGLMSLVILSTAVQANDVPPNTDLTRIEQ